MAQAKAAKLQVDQDLPKPRNPKETWNEIVGHLIGIRNLWATHQEALRYYTDLYDQDEHTQRVLTMGLHFSTFEKGLTTFTEIWKQQGSLEDWLVKER